MKLRSKIGLITFHDTNNFGSYLQTYGLYKKITDLGFYCEVIDYQCRSIIDREIPPKFKITLSLKQILLEVIVKSVLRRKYSNLKRFLTSNMSLSSRCTRSNVSSLAFSYDKFIVGSDIVWGMDIINGDTSYFLDFVKDTNKKFSYASSIGNPWSESDQIKLKPLLSDFSSISVREEESADWIEQLGMTRPNVVCDPTMLLDAYEWINYTSDKYAHTAPYVLVYFGTEKSLSDAKKYAKKYNKKVLYINYGLPVSGVKNIKPTTLEDFLSLFYYADFVCTASYHGMLFSLYFNKQLSYYNRAHKSRMQTLAEKFNICDHEGGVYNLMDMAPVDYKYVNEVIKSYRAISISYLKSILANDK